MRRFFALFLLPVIALPAFLLQQDTVIIAPANLEITGVNAAAAPEITVTVNVTDVVGRTVGDLTLEDFQLGGALSEVAEIVRVEHVSDDNLPFAVVLVIDTSSSMAGSPLQSTQAAAKAFVSSLGDQDTVALVTFDNDPRVLREFTTDKADLLNAIDGLMFGGQTALYDGAVTGIELAANAPYPRRAVILLSDGAEYGGASLSTRDEAPELSPVRGVPVYTVGLGFGLDRSYLERLSASSSANFYESPTPDELAGIYTELARLFRSQYVLTLNFTGALDGKVYPFTLGARNEAGQSSLDAATIRAPIPVPVVSISPEPTAALAAPVTFTANVRGDQPVTQVEFVLGDASSVDTEAPFTFDFDPFIHAPGEYSLTARATDADGDIGEKIIMFGVAAIPSRIGISTDLSALGEISEPVTVTLSADSQTPPQSVDFRVDGISIATADVLPADFTLDPFTFAPGPHTVEFVVTDASGSDSAITQTVQIAALSPILTLDTSGLPEVITEEVSFGLGAIGQTPVETIAFTLNGMTEIVSGAETSYTIRPQEIAPGKQTVLIIVTDQAGTTAPAMVDFNVGVLPPVITLDGLADDDVLDTARNVTVSVGGQTENATVTLLADAQPVQVLQAAPYEFMIDPAVIFPTPGTHLMSISVENEFGGTATQEIRVTVPDTLFPTATPDAAQTAAFEAVLAQATAQAQATLDMQTTHQALATADAQATLDTALTQQAQATANAQATSDAASTQQAQATANAQATLDAASTQEAQAAADAAATDTAIQSATARANAAIQRLATTEARSTLQVQGTIDTQLTEIAQQTLSALSTQSAQATLDTTQAVATQDAATLAAGTAVARQLEQTSVARETAEAQLTEDAQGRETAQAEMALRRQSTLDAESTSQAVATNEAEAGFTAVAQLELTSAAAATAEPTEEPTAEPTATPETPATETPAEEPTIEASAEAEATAVQPTPEPFDPTSTPGAPIDVVATGADSPDSSIALLAMTCGVGLLVLIVVVIVLARRKRK